MCYRMILNMNMPSDWKELFEQWPIIRSLFEKKWEVVRLLGDSSWCHGDNMKLLLFLIQSVQSFGFRKPNIYSQDCCFIMATFVSDATAGSVLQGSRSDSSVDHGIVTEQWSSYIALPEIICLPQYHAATISNSLDTTGPEFVLSIPWRVINFPVRAKPKSWCSQTLFTSLQERQWGRVELCQAPWWWNSGGKAVFSLKPLFSLNVNTQIEGQGKDMSVSFHL